MRFLVQCRSCRERYKSSILSWVCPNLDVFVRQCVLTSAEQSSVRKGYKAKTVFWHPDRVGMLVRASYNTGSADGYISMIFNLAP
ncbi:hypothetical protein OKW27_000317 [Paraburkholderia sp. 35.1]